MCVFWCLGMSMICCVFIVTRAFIEYNEGDMFAKYSFDADMYKVEFDCL